MRSRPEVVCTSPVTVQVLFGCYQFSRVRNNAEQFLIRAQWFVYDTEQVNTSTPRVITEPAV